MSAPTTATVVHLPPSSLGAEGPPTPHAIASPRPVWLAVGTAILLFAASETLLGSGLVAPVLLLDSGLLVAGLWIGHDGTLPASWRHAALALAMLPMVRLVSLADLGTSVGWHGALPTALLLFSVLAFQSMEGPSRPALAAHRLWLDLGLVVLIAAGAAAVALLGRASWDAASGPVPAVLLAGMLATTLLVVYALVPTLLPLIGPVATPLVTAAAIAATQLSTSVGQSLLALVVVAPVAAWAARGGHVSAPLMQVLLAGSLLTAATMA